MSELDMSTKYHVDRLSRLVGGKVKEVVVDLESGAEFGDQFFGLIVEMPDGGERVMWIMADDDGNGPGAVTIQIRSNQELAQERLA